MATPQSESGSIQKIYTLTVYVAAAGTPLLDREGNAIGSSRVGHVYYSINDGQNERGYGFSPIESGMAGPGHVVRDEFEVYKAPAYSRTMEINEAQYSALKDYGEKGLERNQQHFNLQYNGATNSCIDFTWGGLRHAGIHARITLQPREDFDTPITFENRGYEGALKPLNNIRDFKSIPDPVPGSPYNREQTNDLPDRKWWQHLISEGDSQRAPSSNDVQHAAASVNDRNGPFADPILNQLHAAIQRRDSVALDEIGRDFNRSEEGMRLVEQGEKLYAAQQADAQQAQQQRQHQDTVVIRM